MDKLPAGKTSMLVADTEYYLGQPIEDNARHLAEPLVREVRFLYEVAFTLFRLNLWDGSADAGKEFETYLEIEREELTSEKI